MSLKKFLKRVNVTGGSNCISKVQVRLQRSWDRQAFVGFLSWVVAIESRWLILSYNYVCFSAVALQTKTKFARHNGARAPLKVVLLRDFHGGVL